MEGRLKGPTVPGIFFKLNTLIIGDKIQIESGDGKILNYTVVNTKNFDTTNLDLGTVLTSAQAGKPGLNIITSSDSFDKSRSDYLGRTIIFAVQS